MLNKSSTKFIMQQLSSYSSKNSFNGSFGDEVLQATSELLKKTVSVASAAKPVVKVGIPFAIGYKPGSRNNANQESSVASNIVPFRPK